MITYTNPDDEDTQEIPVVALARAAQAEQTPSIAPLADLWEIAPLVMARIMEIVERVVPSHQDQIELAAALAARLHEFYVDLIDTNAAQARQLDELHLANQVMARQLDAAQDRGAYVKGGRR